MRPKLININNYKAVKKGMVKVEEIKVNIALVKHFYGTQNSHVCRFAACASHPYLSEEGTSGVIFRVMNGDSLCQKQTNSVALSPRANCVIYHIFSNLIHTQFLAVS
jgi:hypothetical protein